MAVTPSPVFRLRRFAWRGGCFGGEKYFSSVFSLDRRPLVGIGGKAFHRNRFQVPGVSGIIGKFVKTDADPQP